MSSNAIRMIQVEEYNHSNVNSLEKYDDGAELSDYECKGNSFKAPLDDDNLRKLSYLHRYISHLYDQVNAFLKSL